MIIFRIIYAKRRPKLNFSVYLEIKNEIFEIFQYDIPQKSQSFFTHLIKCELSRSLGNPKSCCIK